MKMSCLNVLSTSNLMYYAIQIQITSYFSYYIIFYEQSVNWKHSNWFFNKNYIKLIKINNLENVKRKEQNTN